MGSNGGTGHFQPHVVRLMARYQDAVEWIALNDNSGQGDPVSEIAGYISTCLVADVWNKDQNDVAKAVAKVRREHDMYVGEEGE